MITTETRRPIKKILILGGGTAGFLAAISMRAKLPELEVVVVRSSKIGTIMVGEGTSDSVPIYLHGYLNIDPARFYREVQPTWKLGIRFVWGTRPHFNYTFSRQLNVQYELLPRPHGFYCGEVFDYTDVYGALMERDCVFLRGENGAPQIPTNVAYHMENHKLVQFLEKYAVELGVVIVEDTLLDAQMSDSGVESLVMESGRSMSADLYVDCSGFRSELLGKACGEPFESFNSTLFCDRAVVGGWARTDEPIKPYTISETMQSGWSWQIEHENFINRGYVYSSDFCTDEEAEQEFRSRNPRIEATRVVKFISGRYRDHWVKNVVAVGNSSGFVEPLQSTALAVICEMCAGLVKVLEEGRGEVRPTLAQQYNRNTRFLWDRVRAFLAVNYKFNGRESSEFWKACRESVDLAGAEDVVDYYRENGPSIAWAHQLISGSDPFGFEGYLTMIVGQNVPYEATYTPSSEEWKFWNLARVQVSQRVQNAYTVEQALATIRDPRWTWNTEMYQRAVRW